MISSKIESKYITVRDGTELASTIYTPILVEGNPQAIPLVWKHDRYHTRNKPLEEMPAFERFKNQMLSNGIAVALVDSRGSGASYGHTEAPFSIIEQYDMYDVTEWFAAQNWCSGKIGMFGRSYSGISQYLAAASCPPHLTIIIPEMALFDLYQFAYPGGIFRNNFAEEWGKNVYQLDQLNPAKGVDEDIESDLLVAARKKHTDNQDIYDLFSHLPYRDSKLKNHDNSIYETNAPIYYKKQIEQSGVVIFHVTGWQDLWVKDTLIAFKNLQVEQGLMIGPWAHNSYCDYLTETITAIFVRYLKPAPQVEDKLENHIHYYTLGAELNNAWRTTSQWPLPQTIMKDFYLEAEKNSGYLSTQPAVGQNAYVNYKANYSTTSGKLSRWACGYGAEINYDEINELSQKSACFTTAEFNNDQEITGHPLLDIYITSDSDDFDIFAFLIDVHKDGYLEYITEGCLRATRRQTGKPVSNYFGLPYYPCQSELLTAVPQGVPVLYKIDLLPISKIIKAGHKLELCLCCSDVDNCLTPRKLPEPNISIGCNASQPSRLILPFI